MKHLGDITKIDGAEIEPVWCITGGSPCQDLSIAGKRAGLKHAYRGDFETTRSGLFMEQVRIVKEMREHDRRAGRTGEMVRPRFLVWENVPGAFSSNFGDGYGDFGAVLEEIIRIAEPAFSLPRLQGKQKWTKAGAIDGDGWSVAWRTHDAQYWGVPQRRRRISVVADFGGDTASEIQFDPKSVSGDIAESGEAGEGFAEAAESGFNPAVRDVTTYCMQGNGIDRADTAGCNGKGWREDSFYTLNTIDRPAVVAPAVALDMTHACDVIRECGEQVPALQARMGTGGNQVPLTYGIGNGQANEASIMAEEVSQTLNTMHDAQAVMCEDVSHALRAKAACAYREDAETYPVQNMVVRRLTPMECERLQGFPDHWTDIGDWVDSKGKKHKGDADSPRYKALGNSIALPFWYWMFCRMAKFLPENATLGSLFDGIGGFPLCWEAIHGKGTARWASEIEEFPIAVTKIRFPEE